MSTHEMHRLNSCWGLGSRSTPHAAILLRPQSASGPLLRVDGFKLSNCRLICGKVLQIYHVESDFTELTSDFVRNDRFGQGTFGQFTAGLIGHMSHAEGRCMAGGKWEPIALACKP